jgi:NifU-like protein involved in Fe-S cluster formation
MSDPLYRKELLRLAADAHGAGRLAAPDATGVAFNPACGDRVSVDLRLDGDRVLEIAHETKACVLAQASASILGRSLKGATRTDVQHLHGEIRALLESSSPPPAPPFEAYAAFEGAVEYTSRHRCVLLPVEAVLEALAAVRLERRL